MGRLALVKRCARPETVLQLVKHLLRMQKAVDSIHSIALNGAWRHIPVIPTFKRWREEDEKFSAALVTQFNSREA